MPAPKIRRPLPLTLMIVTVRIFGRLISAGAMLTFLSFITVAVLSPKSITPVQYSCEQEEHHFHFL